jgi:hypothetical protein
VVRVGSQKGWPMKRLQAVLLAPMQTRGRERLVVEGGGLWCFQHLCQAWPHSLSPLPLCFRPPAEWTKRDGLRESCWPGQAPLRLRGHGLGRRRNARTPAGWGMGARCDNLPIHQFTSLAVSTYYSTIKPCSLGAWDETSNRCTLHTAQAHDCCAAAPLRPGRRRRQRLLRRFSIISHLQSSRGRGHACSVLSVCLSVCLSESHRFHPAATSTTKRA